MADKDFDPFKLSTGLPDELEVAVQSAWFEFDEDYNDGQTLLLKWKVKADSADYDDEDPLMWPCGDGWEVKGKDGSEAVREDGKNKSFHVNSGIGQLIASAMETDARDELVRRYEEDGNGPMQAAMWEGLQFKLERKEYKGTFDGEDRTWSRLLVAEYLGGADEKPAPKKARGAKKATKTPAKATGARKRGSKKAEPELPEGVDTNTVNELAEMVGEYDDVEKFLDAAYDEFEFDEDDEALGTWLEGWANENVGGEEE